MSMPLRTNEICLPERLVARSFEELVRSMMHPVEGFATYQEVIYRMGMVFLAEGERLEKIGPDATYKTMNGSGEGQRRDYQREDGSYARITDPQTYDKDRLTTIGQWLCDMATEEVGAE